MDFDYTDHEYLTECTDGCNAITGWLQSRIVAAQAGKNHAAEQGHRWVVRVRMRTDVSV